MNWTLEYLPEAEDDLKRLDGSAKVTVVKGIRKVLQQVAQCAINLTRLLNRTGLEPVSALKSMLCLVTTKIFLLAAAPTAAYKQLSLQFFH